MFRLGSRLAAVVIAVSASAPNAVADEAFAVVQTETSDGFVTQLFDLDASEVDRFDGTIYWRETGTTVPVTMRLADPAAAVSAIPAEATAAKLDLGGSVLVLERRSSVTWSNVNVQQALYFARTEGGDHSRSARVAITHDPWPIQVLLVFGAATLICSANHLIDIHTGRCPNATMEISIVPPSCKASCEAPQ